MNILLFGPPGAGKGTQSALISSYFGVEHISTGNLFRNAINNCTDLGLKVQGYMDKGYLVPDSIVNDLVDEELSKISGRGFLLDGFPRNISQAKSLDIIMKKKDLDLDYSIFLEISHEILIERLSGRRVCKSCGKVFHIGLEKSILSSCPSCGGDLFQREDDNVGVIRTRMNEYEENTLPLRSYYEKLGKLIVIDGGKKVENVFEEIKLALKS